MNPRTHAVALASAVALAVALSASGDLRTSDRMAGRLGISIRTKKVGDILGHRRPA